jgi:hypothetical protein
MAEKKFLSEDGVKQIFTAVKNNFSSKKETEAIVEGIDVAVSGNQLKVYVDGKPQNDGINIAELHNTASTSVSKTIQVTGTPLADLLNQAGITEIPADWTMQDVLQNMLCTEVYPTTSSSKGTFTLNASAPTVTCSNSASVIAVGTTVNLTVTPSVTSVKSQTASTVSGFENGYADTLGGTVNKSTSLTSAFTGIAQKSGSTYSTVTTITGFTGATGATKSGASASDAAQSFTGVAIALGNNVIKAQETYPSWVGSIGAIASKYIVSNLGNTSESKKSAAVNGDDVTVTPSTQTTTKTIVGVYPVYSNKGTHTQNTNAFEISFDAESTGGMMWFEYPSDRTVTVQIYNSLSSKYEAYEGGFTSEATSRTANGVTYQKWTRTGSAYTDSVKFKFTLSKSTNA